MPECNRCNDTGKLLMNTNTFCTQPYDKDKHQEKHEVMDCPNCCEGAYDFEVPF